MNMHNKLVYNFTKHRSQHLWHHLQTQPILDALDFKPNDLQLLEPLGELAVHTSELETCIYPVSPSLWFPRAQSKSSAPPPFKILDPPLRTENVFPSKIFCGSLLSSSKIFMGWPHLHKFVRKHLPLSILGPLTPAVMYLKRERGRGGHRVGM